MSECSLKDFYRIKEVFTRNLYCSVTGVLLELKDPDIISNYIVSKPLSPNLGTLPVSLNVFSDADAGEEEDDVEE